MILRSLLFLCTLIGLFSCGQVESLDTGIPRIETPSDQIAYLRTKWLNGKHVETALFDHQDRAIEVFRFGLTSSKTLYQYDGENTTLVINYNHSDSSAPGYISIDTLSLEYDPLGRMVTRTYTYARSYETEGPNHTRKEHLAYAPNGDTLVRNIVANYKLPDSSLFVDIDRWERDEKKRVVRHYRLYIMKPKSSSPIDTVWHYSQRFAFDTAGKLAIAWFDHMYLGQFYHPAGPDTIFYKYNSQNRLIEEQHRYTTDMSNKQEAFFANKNNEENWNRKRFFIGDRILPNNNRIDTVFYQYEAFNPSKHLPLKIPALD